MAGFNVYAAYAEISRIILQRFVLQTKNDEGPILRYNAAIIVFRSNKHILF